MPTTTYSTDAQIRSEYALADNLLFDVDKPGGVATFERHRIVIMLAIDSALDARQPPAYGQFTDLMAHVEALGVLAMAFRENASTPNEQSDLFMAQAKEYQRQFETALENVRAPAQEEDEDAEADEVQGNSIPFERC